MTAPKPWVACIGLVLVAGFLALSGHRAHVLGALPLLFVLLCALLHAVGHSGRRGHRHDDRSPP